MADERIRVTKAVSGLPFIRVESGCFADLGRDGVEAAILALGFSPSDLGKAIHRGRYWQIPIRREESETP